jgi:deazaflavin-dependent oxidoreductase (nitroreductase family)
MNEQIKRALAQDRTIDITTIGRQTGQPRRIEIWFHNVDGKLYITSFPGARSWYANMLAHPDFTFHLKETVRADLPATARPVRAEAERREILTRIIENLDEERDLEAWIKGSPLVEVVLKD